MSELIASVVDGVVQQSNSSSSAKTTANNELGKDAFLQLLVCEMQNQDPLEPATNTDYIAQLATFSQLEELQNLQSSNEQSQAFSLVGRNVIIETTDVNGKTYYKSGTVDFVNISGSKTKLSVDGSLYDLDSLYSVIDEEYLIKQGLPTIDKAYELTFDGSNPKNLSFEVNLGDGDTKASLVAIAIDNELLAEDEYVLTGNKVTIYADTLAKYENGVYNPTIVFNDSYYTTVADKVKITVTNHVDKAEDAAADATDKLTDAELDALTEDR